MKVPFLALRAQRELLALSRWALWGGNPFMDPANPPHASNGHNSSAGFNADDAIFTLFRHKWLILAFVILGVVGAITVRFVRPPLYVSKAKVMVHYVLNTREVTPASADAPHAQSLDASAQSILNAEIEIITSLDVAQRVAEAIGPAKILAKKGGGTNLMAAAAVICAGIEVEPPKSSILTICFKHPDPDIVQPVLEAVLQAYMLKHKNVHLMPDDYLVKQRDGLLSQPLIIYKPLRNYQPVMVSQPLILSQPESISALESISTLESFSTLICLALEKFTDIRAPSIWVFLNP